MRVSSWVLSLGLLATAGAVITGSRKCTGFMCITGLHDDRTNIDTYTLDPPEGDSLARNNFGWMAIGFGSQMANSPMVIVWPNSDGTITLSQRTSPGHSMPIASLSTSKSFSNSTTTSITFTVPSISQTTNQTDLIWAYSTVNPRSSSPAAPLVQHDGKGTMRLALLTPLETVRFSPNSTSAGTISGTSTSTGSTATISLGAPIISASLRPVTQSSSDDGDTSKRRKMLIAHAVCGAIATVFLLPMGVLIPRIARGINLSRWWFPAHGAINGIISSVLIITAFAIAKSSLDSAGTHEILATVLLALVIVQIVIGSSIHTVNKRFSGPKTRTGRSTINYIHWILGLSTVLIGWATVYEGLFVQWPDASGTGPASRGIKIAWGVIIVLWTVVYIAGLIVLLPRQIRAERSRRSEEQGVNSVGVSTLGREVSTVEVLDQTQSGDFKA